MTHFDWYNYYEVAEHLSEFDDEGSLRSAISRYYYFAFCSARYYLVEIKNMHKFKYSKAGTHKKVYEYLQKYGNDNEAALGELLETLFEKRNCADYDWIDDKGNSLDKEYFSRELIVVKAKIEEALIHINVIKNNPSDFRI